MLLYITCLTCPVLKNNVIEERMSDYFTSDILNEIRLNHVHKNYFLNYKKAVQIHAVTGLNQVLLD